MFITELYDFVFGLNHNKGISMCIPLWGKLDPDKCYGEYCIDLFPAV